jgi:1,4-dihydroxy-2-naphthoate octaprenyltransferase
MVQSGAITTQQMRIAIGMLILLSLISGIALIYVSVGLHWEVFLFFLGLGLLAILAAVFYTAGKKPYGYAGLGDLSVIMFFGIVGVLGVYYLYQQALDWSHILPGVSCGVFAAGVLNVNNIRDIDSDRQAGKRSIPVRIGRVNAVIYHALLLATGWITAVLYTLLHYDSLWQFAYVFCLPLFLLNIRAVVQKQTPAELDPYLKQMALSTLVFVLFFGISQTLL